MNLYLEFAFMVAITNIAAFNSPFIN